ncbi:unnamed protein product [Protopolystoma xenopodis]|uniref:Uncharacterized protein n=1 Tax=Protopolystoma xenopodis TaxID=117903 RepID=A0A3S5AQX8_9PLAT|nr:unnamed protein product [Protopolystoma xenopodis]
MRRISDQIALRFTSSDSDEGADLIEAVSGAHQKRRGDLIKTMRHGLHDLGQSESNDMSDSKSGEIQDS